MHSKNTKILICTLLTVVLVITMATSAFAAPTTFKDVPKTHWAYSDIERAYADGAIEGVGTDVNGQRLFDPGAQLTKREYIAIMMRAFYPNEVAAAEADSDLNLGDEWYTATDYVCIKYGLNYIWNMQSSDPIFRCKAAAISYSILDSLGSLPPAEEYQNVIPLYDDMEFTRAGQLVLRWLAS